VGRPSRAKRALTGSDATSERFQGPFLTPDELYRWYQFENAKYLSSEDDSVVVLRQSKTLHSLLFHPSFYPKDVYSYCSFWLDTLCPPIPLLPTAPPSPVLPTDYPTAPTPGAPSPGRSSPFHSAARDTSMGSLTRDSLSLYTEDPCVDVQVFP